MKLTNSAKGKVTEMLVSVAATVQSPSLFRISLPLVDDEGIDLLITHKPTDKTLSLQIKSAFKLTARGQFHVDVRKKTLVPLGKKLSESRLLVLVYYDNTEDRLGDTLWVVDAAAFQRLLHGQGCRQGKYTFRSKFTSPNDMWKPYRITLGELGSALLNYFMALS